MVPVPHDAKLVQHRTTLEGLTSGEHLFGEEMSIEHESASTTQEEDDDSTHGEILQPAFSRPS